MAPKRKPARRYQCRIAFSESNGLVDWIEQFPEKQRTAEVLHTIKLGLEVRRSLESLGTAVVGAVRAQPAPRASQVPARAEPPGPGADESSGIPSSLVGQMAAWARDPAPAD